MLYFMYTLTYTVSYPLLTFLIYQTMCAKLLLFDFLAEDSGLFNANMATIVSDQNNMEELLRINMNDIM